jgi:hypothetical protein
MKTNEMRTSLTNAPVVRSREGSDGQYHAYAIGANTRRALMAVLDIMDNIYEADVHEEITAALEPLCANRKDQA